MGEGLLELPTAGVQSLEAELLGAAAGLAQQPRLADAGRPLEQQQRTVALWRVVEQPVDERELGVALQQG